MDQISEGVELVKDGADILNSIYNDIEASNLAGIGTLCCFHLIEIRAQFHGLHHWFLSRNSI